MRTPKISRLPRASPTLRLSASYQAATTSPEPQRQRDRAEQRVAPAAVGAHGVGDQDRGDQAAEHGRVAGEDDLDREAGRADNGGGQRRRASPGHRRGHQRERDDLDGEGVRDAVDEPELGLGRRGQHGREDGVEARRPEAVKVHRRGS